MISIKAIQTQYNGYLFRSRLEARCARFEHGKTPRFRGGYLNA